MSTVEPKIAELQELLAQCLQVRLLDTIPSSNSAEWRCERCQEEWVAATRLPCPNCVTETGLHCYIPDLLAALTAAQTKNEYWRAQNICLTCGGQPATVGACVCGGIGTAEAERNGLRLACFELESALAAAQVERDALRQALMSIQEMAAEDLRQGRTFVCHSYLPQIEANARAVLMPAEQNGRLNNADTKTS